MRSIVRVGTLLVVGVYIAAVALATSIDRPVLPNQFFVSIGVTMPFSDSDPVAQSGAIYFDQIAGRLRIDNFWMGTQRTFIADTQRKRAYMVNGGECAVSVISGVLKPVEVPADAARDLDANSVRGVLVDRFHKIIREELDLVHVDFFMRRTNITVISKDHDTGVAYWTPWRILTRRVPRQEMIGTTATRPNWRFFGEEVTDEIVKYGSDGRALAVLMHDLPITMDFYNFVPLVPDPSIFEPPEAICAEAPTNEFDSDLDVFEVQRHIMELSFNNEEGRRLMGQIWGTKAPSLQDDPTLQKQQRSKQGGGDL